MHGAVCRVVALSVVRLSTAQDGSNEAWCEDCDCPVDIHQPDVERPQRLLGTCPECGTWYLLVGAAGPDLDLEIEGPNETLTN